MKKRLSFFGSLFLVCMGLNHLAAQSLADLNGITWKSRQASFDLLSDAQSNAGIISTFADTPSGQVNLKFREVAFNNVRDLLETGRETAVSIVEGYDMAQTFMHAEPIFADVDQTERKKVFDELVNILKN